MSEKTKKPTFALSETGQDLLEKELEAKKKQEAIIPVEETETQILEPRPTPFVENIDFYKRDGKIIFMKEGLMKKAKETDISTEILYEKRYPEDPLEGPLQYYEVIMKGWIGPKDNPTRETEDKCDFDRKIAMNRAILKAISKRRLSEKDIEIDEDGLLQIVDPAKKFHYLEYFTDMMEFAQRTVIGKCKRRIWGELLGVTTIEEKELELEQEELGRLNKK